MHIRVWLNGRLITDIQPTAETTREVTRTGGFALQVHPPAGSSPWSAAGSKVHFHHMRIKELTPQQ